MFCAKLRRITKKLYLIKYCGCVDDEADGDDDDDDDKMRAAAANESRNGGWWVVVGGSVPSIVVYCFGGRRIRKRGNTVLSSDLDGRGRRGEGFNQLAVIPDVTGGEGECW